MIVVVMGGGLAKSTAGAMLAAAPGLPLIEADDFHSVGNVEKMRGGTPLDDAARTPWLDAVPTGCSRRQQRILSAFNQ